MRSFGRAPLAPTVIEELSQIGANYNNLEYGLAGGKRGGRAAYLEQGLAVYGLVFFVGHDYL